MITLARRTRVAKSSSRALRLPLSILPPAFAQALTILPLILLTLCLTYTPLDDATMCTLESHWTRLFRAKDAGAIHVVQTTLRCCGLRSPRDRAWPFPDRAHGADACLAMFGWTRGCMESWGREERLAGGTLGLAAAATWVLMVSCILRIFPGRDFLANTEI